MNVLPTDTEPKFPSTHWSWLIAAGESSERGVEHLGKLLKHYEFALKHYIMKRFRCDDQSAQDLFQGFVLEIILGKQMVAKAKRLKGHQFRSFILAALNNYVSSDLRKRWAQKRQPPGGICSLDELVEQEQSFVSDSGIDAFDLDWARGVLNQALDRMEAECAKSGGTVIWGVFEGRLRRPILDGVEPTPYDELAKRFGFNSPTQAQNALVTAKRIFSRVLRSVIADYAEGETAIEVELRELQLILASAATNGLRRSAPTDRA
jgi:hypothetical protein